MYNESFEKSASPCGFLSERLIVNTVKNVYTMFTQCVYDRNSFQGPCQYSGKLNFGLKLDIKHYGFLGQV